MATEPARLLAAGARQCALNAIEANDGDLRAIITVISEIALARARACDAALREGVSMGVSLGMPVVLKDNIYTAGTRTTSGSEFLEQTGPRADAVVVQRLARAGAIIVGKANLDEFALGGTTQNRHIGGCRNP